MRSSITLSTLAIVLVCESIAVATGADPDQPAVPNPQQQMVETAQKTYEASRAMWNVGAGGVTLEAAYIWSKRWADAEADGAAPGARRKAYLAHAQRMKQLNDIISVKHQVAAVGGEEDKLQATRYYLAEAEYLLSKKDNSTLSDQKQSPD